MKKKLKLKKSGLYIILLFISVITFNFSFKLPKKITPIKMDWNNYPKELTYIFNYNNYVKTKEEIPIYDENIKVIGTINKNVDLELDNVFLNNNKMFFRIKNLNYYIEPSNIEKISEFNKNKRFKKYIVFNKNVTTKDKTTFYNENGYAYKINKSINLPLIIKDDDKYYVEFNNELLYVKKDDSSLVDSNNTKEKTRTNIRTLTYHAIYKDGEECKNKSICHPYKQFNEHMKYLKDNNYLTLTMEELEMFLDKKINIPNKSIVITLDDGNLAQNAIEILDKYELNATYFIITGRYDSYKLKTKYVDYESHTDNLHNNYKCPGGNQGGQLLCEKEDVILNDLKTSQEKLGGSKYISYPFFDYNDRAINLLKKSGFHLAFVGQANSDGYSTYNTDRFKIRRKTIFATDSLEKFKSYLK
ncbi:MAG: polysaccharide deacetylase family protein [Bacilli bacterium]|nr:polysaccharide deacetylase family protein [Bacilli bacterium]